MRHEIRPYVGVDGLRFGMTAQEVHDVLGEPRTRFRRDSRTPGDPDTEEFADLFVSFDAHGKCDFVEIFGGEVFLEGHQLFPGEYVEVLEGISAMGGDPRCDNAGCESMKYGVTLYVPDATDLAYDDCDEPPLVVAAGAFRRGYWDAFEARCPGNLGLPPHEWLEELKRERA